MNALTAAVDLWRHRPWPLPALLSWLAAWAVFNGLQLAAVPRPLAFAAAVALCLGAASALPAASRWRRAIVGAGFPLAALGSAMAAGVPGWAWLLPLGLLALAYPLRAWRDAPLYPTPAAAVDGLSRQLVLPAGARVLDAGCGLGHGLRALRAQWPQARFEGIEWSWPLWLAARLRCPWALVRRGDMWSADWSGHAVVYLFQRPESMARAWAKACAEMAPGSWLASLDFAVPGLMPHAVLRQADAPPLWLYRVPQPLRPAAWVPRGAPPVAAAPVAAPPVAAARAVADAVAAPLSVE